MITIPSADTFKILKRLDKEFPSMIGNSLKYWFKILDWSPQDASRHLSGQSAETWRKYLQPSYTKQRRQHVIAAFSWASKISMSAIFKGEQITQYWPEDLIKLMVTCGFLSNKTFRLFVEELLATGAKQQQGRWVEGKLKTIESLSRENVQAPYPLDLEDFRLDYYRSIARALRLFRQHNNIDIDTMAQVGNLEVQEYLAIENEAKPPKAIPLILAAKLKLGFQLDDTVQLLAFMDKYPGCRVARTIQQEREMILIELLKGKSKQALKYAKDAATRLRLYQQDLRSFRHNQQRRPGTRKSNELGT